MVKGGVPGSTSGVEELNKDDKFHVHHRGRRLEFTIVKCKFTGELYANQRTTVLKNVYTSKDAVEDKEYDASPLLCDGETVLINGNLAKVIIHGDYSDGVQFV